MIWGVRSAIAPLNSHNLSARQGISRFFCCQFAGRPSSNRNAFRSAGLLSGDGSTALQGGEQICGSDGPGGCRGTCPVGHACGPPQRLGRLGRLGRFGRHGRHEAIVREGGRDDASRPNAEGRARGNGGCGGCISHRCHHRALGSVRTANRSRLPTSRQAKARRRWISRQTGVSASYRCQKRTRSQSGRCQSPAMRPPCSPLRRNTRPRW